MKRRVLALIFTPLLLALSSLLAAPTVVAQTQNPHWRIGIPGPKYKPGVVMVRFRPGVPGKAKAAAHAAVHAQVFRKFSNVPGLEEVRLPKGMSIELAIMKYQKNPNVLHAHPSYATTLHDLPNDPQFGQQWGLNNTGQTGLTDADIDAPEAWTLTQGSNDVVVAVVDSGVDYNHEDLAANMFRNDRDCDGDGHDTDGNGYADDCYGIDIPNDDTDPMDDNGHGTHVAGIIGAAGDNNVGVAGVNWHVKIMACKYLAANGHGWTDDAAACLAYISMMKDRGANIVAVNFSSGFSLPDPDVSAAIDDLRQKGILLVASAGNGGDDYIGDNNDLIPDYPSAYFLPNIIAVANTTPTDVLSVDSNYGPHTVHLGAPGTNILSTMLPGNNIPVCPQDALYCSIGGTSMAAPFVAGVAALLKAHNPSLDWRAVKNLILASGDTKAALSETITKKRLNAHRALTCSNSPLDSALRPIESETITSPGDSVDLAALNINCAQPGGDVPVTVNGGESVVTLHDNGTGTDLAAGDGIYSGQFVPGAPGSYALSFPSGETVTVKTPRSYQFAETPFSYWNITGTSLDFGDDETQCLNFGFPIEFGGVEIPTVCVGSNGVLAFKDNYNYPINESLPTPDTAFLVAPFWDDLVPTPDSDHNVFWEVIGSSPNREAVIEWRDVRHYGMCSSSDTVKFQVVLTENSSDILFNYADTTFGSDCQEGSLDGGGSATIGIQIGRSTATQYSFNEAKLTDNMSILWTTGSLAVSPSSLDFGGVEVNVTSAPKTVTLSNERGSTVTISKIEATGDFDKQADHCTGTLAVGSTCTVEVTFTPTSAGASDGNLIITSDAPGSPQEVSLSGSGVVPIVALSPASLNFGQQALGATSAAKTVTLTNDGGATLIIESITPALDDFTATHTCGTSLSAGQHCAISVTFTPKVEGLRDCNLTVTTNAESSPDAVQLSGQGVLLPGVSLSPQTLSFGGQKVGTTSSEKSVTLLNTGAAVLNIERIDAGEPFDQMNNCAGTLAADASCAIQVTFTPSDSGPVAGQLTVTSDGPNSPDRVDLTGNGTVPDVALSPSSLDFGSQRTGTESSPKPVTLTNSGGATLSIRDISATGDFAAEHTCGTSLNAGQSCTINVTFKPSAAGPANGRLSVESDADGSPHGIDLSGKGTIPGVALSPASLDFGLQRVGTESSPKPVTLENDGDATLSITGIGTTRDDFTVSHTCGTSLNAGGTCAINITFKPATPGGLEAELRVETDASSSPDTVQLSGEGEGGQAVSLSPASLDLGPQKVGTTSSPKTVTLTNSGTAALNIADIQTTAPFAQTHTCGATLAAKASCAIQITFTPTAEGPANGQLTVTSDAPGSPHHVALSGEGATSNVSLNPLSLDFGKQVITSSQTKHITLTNSGEAQLRITSVGIYGDADHFQYGGQDCMDRNPIPPAGSCRIDLTFTPQSVGTKTVTLQVGSDAPSSPHEIGATGQGTDFELAMASGAPNTATVNAGESAGYSLIIAPVANLVGNAALSCSWPDGRPRGASCAVSPTTVTLDGTHAAEVVVTVTTTARSMAPVLRQPLPPGSSGYPGSYLAIWLLALAALGSLALRRRHVTMAFASALFLVVLWTACGGGGAGGTSFNNTTDNSTLPGTYSLTVTATVSGVAHSTGLTLDVE